MALSFPPDKAWQPLPSTALTADHARHLLRRAGWTARPDDIERAVREGLGPTLERLFPARPAVLPEPRAFADLATARATIQRDIRGKTGEERRRLQRELRERQRGALRDLAVEWLTFAADSAHAAVAKWTLFLSDVYVVSAEKVQDPQLLHQHFTVLAQHAFGPAPALTKAVSRSPAMALYLDLNRSQRRAPNENFARELFELFVLGEGHYTEKDIKEAARAFTGYRVNPLERQFRYVPGQHDASPKTIFGTTGTFTGDEVIDVTYRQPAAAAFLPQEMARFYLSDAALPVEYLRSLGDLWRGDAFALRALIRRFFGSQLFFAPEFRANFIKSPIQFYLGLIQDLQLDIAPLARMTLNPLRQMGQALFTPPNVRGWVGGRTWINSATITARRQWVESLFTPINERALNADERADLAAAREHGAGRYTLSTDDLASFATPDPTETAGRLAAAFLAVPATTAVVSALSELLVQELKEAKHPRQALLRTAASLLQSPHYQLC